MGLMTLAASTLFYSCRKTFREQLPERTNLKTMSGQVPLTIDIEEMYAALPQTIMYNLSDKVKLYIGQTQWRYGDNYLMVRVPVSDPAKPNCSYLYGVKSSANPTGPVRVYLKQVLPDAHSTAGDFSGKQMWINFQDWNIYGVRYDHNVPVSSMSGIPVNPYWETIMLNLGLFYMDGNGKIAVYDNPAHPDPGSVVDQIMSENPDPGPDGRDSDGKNGDDLVSTGKGSNFFNWLFNGIKNLVEAVGDWLSNLEGGTGSGSGSGYGGDWGPGPGNGYGDNGVPGNGSGSGGGGGGIANPEPPVNIWDLSNPSDQLWASAEDVGDNAPVLVWGNELNSGMPPFTFQHPNVTFVKNLLGLGPNEANWLGQHLDKTSRIMEFLIQYIPDVTLQQKEEIAREHLIRMMSDPEYYDFVNTYDQNNAGMWWMNESWLDNPANDFQLAPNQASQQFPHLTAQEQILINMYPVQAFVINMNRKKATTVSDATGLPQPHNGKQDAFRHAFFQAINVRDVPPRLIPYVSSSTIVLQFSTAHESEVPSALQLEKDMDLFNNFVGISYCWNCILGITSDDYIRGAIMMKVTNGELKYLTPLNGAAIIPNVTQLVPTNQ